MEEADNSTDRTNICPDYEGTSISLAIDVLGSISLTIALLVICLALLFIVLLRWWTVFNQRLILYLLLANIVGVVTSGLARLGRYGFCAFGGFVDQIGGWAVANAYICITATLMLRAFFTTSLEKKWDMPTIVFIFLSPFLFNWVPFINYTYGSAGPSCWIKYNEVVNGTCVVNVFGEVLQLALWYVPLYLILTIMILLYIIILVKFWRHRKKWMNFNDNVDLERRQALNYLVSLLVYPLIYFTVNLFSLVTRAYSLANPSTPSPILWLVNLVVYPQQFTSVAIVFLVSIRKKLTLVNLKATSKEWRHKTKVEEYKFNSENERTMSMRQILSSFSRKKK